MFKRLHITTIITLVLTTVYSFAATTNLVKPVKSPNDHREYGSFVLPNGMKVLLVSDPKADKAAVSMSVNIGSSSEPDDHLGLAHFLEHMLFMGTKKYPDVSAYKDYIIGNGGEYNAYTQSNITNYSFTIKPDRLDGALDRFAQFFIAPLFDEHYVEREKHAVNSEYELKRKQEIRRIVAAMQKAFNPKSPYSRFGTGNLKTLVDMPKGSLREALVSFHKKNYSAHIMALTVLGKEPLVQLKKMVEDKFVAVPVTDVKPYEPSPETWSLSSDRVPAAIAIRPISEMHKVVLLYPVPAAISKYKVNPYAYLSMLITNAAPGSFYDIVHRRGWVEALSVSSEDLDSKEGQLEIDIGLSPQGLAHLKEIMQLLYAYVGKIDQKGVEPWRYEEMKRLSELSFRYALPQAPYDYVTELSNRQHRYPLKDLLKGGKVLEHYDEAVLKQYISAIRPDNVLSVVIDPSMPADQIEPRYEVSYMYKKVSDTEIKEVLKSPEGISMKLPEKNPFIPEDLNIKTVSSEATDIPQQIISKKGFSLWHKLDTTFGAPRASATILFRSPVAADTAENAALEHIWALMLSDKFDPVIQQASQAGLGFDIQGTDEGLSIQLFGYDQKLPILLKQILEAIADEKVDLERFERIKNIYAQDLVNTQHDLPFNQVVQAALRSMIKGIYDPKKLYDALGSLTAKKLQEYKRSYLKKLDVQMLTLGNLTESESLKLAKMLKEIVLTKTTLAKVPEPQVLLPKSKKKRIVSYSVPHPDAVVAEAFMDSKTTQAEWAKWSLLAQLIQNPFGTELRTKQQLGYTVLAQFFSQRNNPGLIMVIESSNTSATGILKRTAKFRDDFGQYLGKLDAKTFEAVKEGLISMLSRKDTSLADRTSRYLVNLQHKNKTFDFNQKIIEAVKKIDVETLAKFYKEEILDSPRVIVGISEGNKSLSGEANSTIAKP